TDAAHKRHGPRFADRGNQRGRDAPTSVPGAVKPAGGMQGDRQAVRRTLVDPGGSREVTDADGLRPRNRFEHPARVAHRLNLLDRGHRTTVILGMRYSCITE